MLIVRWKLWVIFLAWGSWQEGYSGSGSSMHGVEFLVEQGDHLVQLYQKVIANGCFNWPCALFDCLQVMGENV